MDIFWEMAVPWKHTTWVSSEGHDYSVGVNGEGEHANVPQTICKDTSHLEIRSNETFFITSSAITFLGLRVQYKGNTILREYAFLPGGGTPIYFLYRDVPTVRVSFSGSSVFNRAYNFTFSCLKQGHPHKYSPFLPLRSHNFRWFLAPSLKCMKMQTYMYRIRPAWSSLEQGKKLQHFLLDRVTKFTYLCLEQGQGFVESAEPLYPNSCWVHPPGLFYWAVWSTLTLSQDPRVGVSSNLNVLIVLLISHLQRMDEIAVQPNFQVLFL